MHPYRTHHCAQLRAADVGSTVRLSGWIHRKRDHGGVLFIDLRDHYGLTQIVGVAGSEAMELLDGLRLESVVTVTGEPMRTRATSASNNCASSATVFKLTIVSRGASAWISSAIVLLYAAVHIVGTLQLWRT